MTILQYLSAATGFLAAVFWFWSARVRINWGPIGGMVRFQTIDNTLRAQGLISTVAATFSGLSVLCQAIAPFF